MPNSPSDNNEPVADRNSRANLKRLLNDMIQQPERRAELAEEIERIFAQEKAVMVLDMSGFSRTTMRHGIVAFLLMIHQNERLARPCIEEHGGMLVKAEADNLFCLFDTVSGAVDAAQEITRRLNAANMVLPEDRQIYVAVGIGYGRILNVADEDIFGSEVNLASKLGEDVAEMGDILLTPAAGAEMAHVKPECREERISISGMELVYYAVR